MFGSSVTYLVIDMQYYNDAIPGTLHYNFVTSPLISHIDSLSNAIQSFRQLEYLEVRCSLLRSLPMPTTSQAWRIPHLLSALHAAQPRLMQLKITFYPSFKQHIPTHSEYLIDRNSFLDNILACNEMKDALRQFPTLRSFSLKLYENDISDNRQKWWRSEIQSRLHRDLHAAILAVELRPQISM